MVFLPDDASARVAQQSPLAGVDVEPHIPAIPPPVGDDPADTVAPIGRAALARHTEQIREGRAATIPRRARDVLHPRHLLLDHLQWLSASSSWLAATCRPGVLPACRRAPRHSGAPVNGVEAGGEGGADTQVVVASAGWHAQRRSLPGPERTPEVRAMHWWWEMRVMPAPTSSLPRPATMRLMTIQARSDVVFLLNRKGETITRRTPHVPAPAGSPSPGVPFLRPNRSASERGQVGSYFRRVDRRAASAKRRLVNRGLPGLMKAGSPRSARVGRSQSASAECEGFPGDIGVQGWGAGLGSQPSGSAVNSGRCAPAALSALVLVSPERSTASARRRK